MDVITAIPAITALCYLLAEVIKMTKLDNRHLPALCGVAGTAIGVGCFLWAPGYLPADNVFVAAAIGAISGLGATGVNQVVKQEVK